MKNTNVVQLNNDYIKDETLKKKYELQENTKRHRFMGWLLLLVMLIFILPTYNLIGSYQKLQKKKETVVKLKQDYKDISHTVKEKKELANRLKNDDYAAKYARAKYYYSKKGEIVFSIPKLIPKQ